MSDVPLPGPAPDGRELMASGSVPEPGATDGSTDSTGARTDTPTADPADTSGSLPGQPPAGGVATASIAASGPAAGGSAEDGGAGEEGPDHGGPGVGEPGVDGPGQPRRIARLRASAGAFWASVRPRSRRGALLGIASIGALAAVFSVAFLLGAGAFAAFYGEYGFHPETNALGWAALEPAFAGQPALCASCHEREFAKASGGKHAGIGCESCHGALGDHALASPGTTPAEVAVAVPTDGVCIRCHVQATGRPADFRQIVPADHYAPVCLQCHDPHTGISRRPPVVQHPVDDTLPPCVTCHGPDGFKARDQRHPDVGMDDKACLACHLPGRGPDPSGTAP